jgi:2,3-bisphosphoglycerate-dependent phosphoglycerate mutase
LNLFCGWYNAELSNKGRQEAVDAGKAIKQANLKFDVAHTSVLKRANLTLDSILAESGQTGIPIQKTWRLNERHYGGLTGMDKAETAKKYGEEQVQIWRRSYDTPPPPMEPDHKYYKTITEDPIYKDGPTKDEFPMFESLKLTIARTLPYWNDVIIPQLKEGKSIIIAAHGNSLRGIVKHLDRKRAIISLYLIHKLLLCLNYLLEMSDEAIMGLNLPTGIPFVYELDDNFKPVVSMKFLGDEVKLIIFLQRFYIKHAHQYFNRKLSERLWKLSLIKAKPSK